MAIHLAKPIFRSYYVQLNNNDIRLIGEYNVRIMPVIKTSISFIFFFLFIFSNNAYAVEEPWKLLLLNESNGIVENVTNGIPDRTSSDQVPFILVHGRNSEDSEHQKDEPYARAPECCQPFFS